MKKNKLLKIELIIIACIILISAIVGCRIILEKRRAKVDIKNMVVAYMKNIQDREYKKLTKSVIIKDADHMSQDEFVQRNKNIYQGMDLTALDITNIRVKRKKNGDYKVNYHCKYETVAGEISFDNHVTIVQDQKQYKILWDDSVIYPSLKANYKVRIKHLKASRGRILDRNGMILAGEGTASSVGLVPGKMKDKAATIRQMARLLNIDQDAIMKAINKSWVTADSFVPITTIDSVSEENYDEEVAQLHNELLELPGVQISDTSIRSYPGKEFTAHLIGYVRNIDAEELEKHKGERYNDDSVIGKSGLEATYEQRLRAMDGYEIYIEDDKGEILESLAKVKKKDGKDVQLSLDFELQKILFQEFQEDNGCSVAMNPYTGEILAVVSTPSYDTNEFVRGISTERWNELNEDENNPMMNRFKQKWCPGSSIKPIIAGIGLQTRSFTAEEEFTYEETLRWQKDTTWGSYFVTTLHEYQPVNLDNALICSDNIYFAKAGIKIGINKMESNLKRLGFRQDIPVNLALSKSQYSNTDHIETEIQLADTSFGQGQLLVNPVHLATMYTAFSNGGNIMKPTIEYLPLGKGEVWIPNAFSAEATNQVLQGLIGVVNYPSGTGYAAHSDNYVLAGKTGTAELKSSRADKKAQEIGWFSVFTTDSQLEKPILILSMVEDVKETGGSKYVVEKDHEVLIRYLGY